MSTNKEREAQIRQIAAKYNIVLRQIPEVSKDIFVRHALREGVIPNGAAYNPVVRTAFLEPMHTDENYAAALHEMGHALDPHGLEANRIASERAAWAWARAHALEWTQDMEAHAIYALGTYDRLKDIVAEGCGNCLACRRNRAIAENVPQGEPSWKQKQVLTALVELIPLW